ncbi:MAG TPA: alpha/beta hydrolase [Bryobacteraceae bacterium]|nr:alpha/beta hydrolase [Bryobacteraceae bacterium]
MRLLSRGSGDPILFIHGIPTSKKLWDGVVDRLFERFTCYTLDLPGLGEEPATNHRLGELDRIVEEIERLRIERGCASWNVVGHDAGSAIAVLYAHRFAQRVRRLVLISPALFPEIRPFYLFQFLRKPLVGELMAPCIHPLIWRVAMRRACQGENDTRAALTAFESPFRGPLGPWRMMRLLRWGRPAEVLGEMPARLPQLQMPTLIFHGAEDPAIPVSFAYRTAALIADAKLAIVKAGHFVPLNCPATVAEGLESFLTAERAAVEEPGTCSAPLQPFFSALSDSSTLGASPAAI